MGVVQPAGTNSLSVSDYELGKFVDLNGGTNPGTVAIRTVSYGGTVGRPDARTSQNILTFGTQVITAGTAYATIVGSASVGAGTSIWVQDLSVNNPNGTVAIAVGFNAATSGKSVLLKGIFGTQGAVGIEKAYPKPVNAGMTNCDLVVYHGAAATVDYSFSYIISA